MSCVCVPTDVDGYHYSQWIGDHFHDCVYTPTQRASFILGLVSLIIWVPALFPQILQNYRQKRTDALSFGFLIQWLLGDISNLIGCLWTNQLPTQTYTAAYFCITDIILLGQTAYYRYWYHPSTSHRSGDQYTAAEEEDGLISSSSHSPNGVHIGRGPPSKHMYSVALFTLITLSSTPFITSQSLATSLPLCNSSVPLSLVQLIAGSLASWISGLLYFTSRIPQLLHNYSRQSTHGLSLTLFLLSILANLCYGLSVVLRLNEGDEGKFWRATAPFLMGSLGTIVLDLLILLQSVMYTGKGEGYEEIDEREERRGKGSTVSKRQDVL